MFFFNKSILLLSLFSSLVFAFDNSYNSVSSYDGRSLAGIRDIYNAPFSFCRKDGLSDEQCDKVSLNIGGETFKNIFIDTNIAERPFSAFTNTNESTIWSIVNNYKLENQKDVTFGIPTLGQLDHLIVNGLVPRGISTGYWYWSTNSHRAEIAYPNTATPDGDSNAMIRRLVSGSYPSTCSENDCGYFKDDKPWTLQSASGSAFTVRTNWGYTLNGRHHSWAKTWKQGKYNIPAGATGVWMQIWHDRAPGYSGSFYNIETRRGMSPVVCIKQFGSLFVTSADEIRGWCW